MRTIVLKLAFPEIIVDDVESCMDPDDEDFDESAQILGILGFDNGQVQLVAMTSCPCPDEEHGPSVNAFPGYVVDARIENRDDFEDEEFDFGEEED